MKKIFITLMITASMQLMAADPSSSLMGQCEQKSPTQYLLGLTEGIKTTLMPKDVKTSLSNDQIASTACKNTLAKKYAYRFNLMLRAEIRKIIQSR